MLKSKLCLVLVILGIVAFLIGACANKSPSEVRSAVEVKDVTLDYLRENDTQNAPSSDVVWQEEAGYS